MAATDLFMTVRSTFTAIADAIRDRLGENITLTPLQMPAAIRRIDNGGQLSQITIQPQATTFVETPAAGYYGIGQATVLGDTNLVAGNVKKDVTIFGVTGTYDVEIWSGTLAEYQALGTYDPDKLYAIIPDAT